MPNFAIARIAKISSWGSLGGSESHAQRKRDTPNADPERQAQNRQLIGTGEHLIALVRERIGEQKIRKNAVLCVDMFLGASPEYFQSRQDKQADAQHLEKWVETNVDWLNRVYGDRVVSAVLHLDEKTPHIQVHLVPLDHNGKLNCRALFGGRDKLRALQDTYASVMAPEGLERGVRNSRARHQEVRQFYSQLAAELPELDLELPQVNPLKDRLNLEGYRQRAQQAVQEQLDPAVAVLVAKSQDRDRAVLRAKEYQQTAIEAQARAEAAEQTARDQLRQVRGESQLEITQVRTETSAQIEAIQQQAEAQIQQTQVEREAARRQVAEAAHQVSVAQSVARMQAQKELEVERRQLQEQRKELEFEQRMAGDLQRVAVEAARRELQGQLRQRNQEYELLQMKFKVSSDQVQQLQKELQEQQTQRVKVFQRHEEQLLSQGQEHAEQSMAQKLEVKAMGIKLTAARQVIQKQEIELDQLKEQVAEQQQTIAMVSEQVEVLKVFPSFLNDLGYLLEHRGNGRVLDGKLYKLEVTGHGYLLNAKDGRGMLLEIVDGAIEHCSVQMRDVQQLQSAAQLVERQEKQKRNQLEL